MPVPTIEPQAVAAQIKAGGRLQLIDVRTPAEFARVHAVGAQSMPLDSLDARQLAGQQEAEKPTYVICHSGGRSAKAVEQLIAAGCKNVFSVAGGTSSWQQLGLPVEVSSHGVISLERQVRIAAGSLVLTGLLLARWIHPAFVWLSAFVGAGLIFAGVTDFCGMGLLLAKFPWNRKVNS